MLQGSRSRRPKSAGSPGPTRVCARPKPVPPTLPSGLHAEVEDRRTRGVLQVLRARTQLASIKGAVGSTRAADHDAASVSLAGTFICLWRWQSNLNATWAPDLAP